MEKEPIIRAERVSKTYHMGDVVVHALREVDFSLNAGDYVAIMGPSGSGKTTLLDTLSALSRPTSGEVYIKGQRISHMSDSELARARGKTIGFVFQTFNLIPRLSARENVMLPLWFQDADRAQRGAIADRVLSQVGLEHRKGHRPGELSGGQRQRVAIARALAVDPDVIVADEPTGNLDSESGEQIMGIFDDLHKGGTTILMVTHEHDIAAHAHTIIRLRDGQIAERGHNGHAPAQRAPDIHHAQKRTQGSGRSAR